MRAAWSALVLVALLCCAFIGFMAGLLYNVDAPKDEQIEAQIAQIRSELQEARSTAEQFGPNSLMHVQAALRAQILMSTLSMLEQKRASTLRIIRIDYRIDGSTPRKPSSEENLALDREIEEAATAQKNAAERSALYSGGLLKVLIDAEAQSHLVRLALLKQHRLWINFGFAASGDRPSMPPLGNMTSDRSAI